ncbi:hypothetical protein Pcinc_008391 [Petrolisthes cinctipes]|uniref:Uncharacterized protein n=1 Tax=Petrolisthes cinctipes TaxID=88211 RepID=A0AAE1KXK6_PETCI|nr:hypothetical protein Pcinc_008391 [Petrolisthes cinctipes]
MSSTYKYRAFGCEQRTLPKLEERSSQQQHTEGLNNNKKLLFVCPEMPRVVGQWRAAMRRTVSHHDYLYPAIQEEQCPLIVTVSPYPDPDKRFMKIRSVSPLWIYLPTDLASS